STRIYVNTIKKAYKAIKDSGVDAKYFEKDKGDYLEVYIQIPKK
ncbi:MAG: nucleoid occlusion protein, partial [Tissierellia bacterium]|nr:nucleoid occlusion protein [Tissierellia bacterium]